MQNDTRNEELMLLNILKARKEVHRLEQMKAKLLKKDTQSTQLSPYLQIHSSLYSGDKIEELEDDSIEYKVPEHCIPIRADVRCIDWKKLGENIQFDVIVMDPPWQLASANPTRGVTIGYEQLSDAEIQNMDLPSIQKEGFLFIWVINAKFAKTLEMLKKWGYKYVDEIIWVKRTVNRRLAKGHGFFLQHAKETCLVGVKGNPKFDKSVKISDVIFAERRGQSQKPEELYNLVESLVPNGKYLEIFGRKNNLRNFWVTIGNEI